MKKKNDSCTNNENLLKLAEVSKDKKLLKAEELLEHVENCIYTDTRPDPEKIKQADILLNEIYNKDPQIFSGDKVYLWEMLGWAYHIFGDMRKAEKCLRKQASLQPGCADAYLNLGGLYDNNGMPGLALTVYVEGLKESPDDPYLLHNIAMLAYKNGFYETAYKYIYKAIDKNPNCPYNQELKEKISDETFLSLHLMYGDYKKDETPEDTAEEAMPESSGLPDKLTPEKLNKLIEDLTEIEMNIDITSLCGKHKAPRPNKRRKNTKPIKADLITERDLIELFIKGAESGKAKNLHIDKSFMLTVLIKDKEIIAVRLPCGDIVLNGQKYPPKIAESQALLKEITRENNVNVLLSDNKTIVQYYLNPLRDYRYNGNDE